ncbi:P-loop containing nucleoside triphosphate hydrolase protein [Xylariaceae sp. FL1019]|nr:P-loop containing nucleoside triphosphate hydrolase protein [Xylariaceae sp. FL1019]
MDLRNGLFGKRPQPAGTSAPQGQSTPPFQSREQGYDQRQHRNVEQSRPLLGSSSQQNPPPNPSRNNYPPSAQPNSSHAYRSPGTTRSDFTSSSQPVHSREDKPSSQQRQRDPFILKVIKLGSNFLYQNTCLVSPLDFPEYAPREDGLGNPFVILVNHQHYLTAKVWKLTSERGSNPSLESGQIALSAPQRLWLAVEEQQEIHMQIAKVEPPQLASVTVEPRFTNELHHKANSRPVEVINSVEVTRSPEVTESVLTDAFFNSFRNTVLSRDQLVLAGSLHEKFCFKILDVAVVDGRETSFGKVDVKFTEGVSFRMNADTSILKIQYPKPLITSNIKLADLGIGGLDGEFMTIFRRAFASRTYPPHIVRQLGQQHVKGLLLYGPPGTGKTLIARELSKRFLSVPPERIKIINGPEVLNKYVGASEENVRKVFADAEKDWKNLKDASGLHVIIFDELDAVCKQRGSGAGGGTGTGDSVVNQLLSKLDGVEQLGNILLIGMTNRKDMIDDALLRPGRLEVHVEISLPDEHGRLQILNIHTQALRRTRKLAADINLSEFARLTKNFSGAELSGLVRAALSYAFTRHSEVGGATEGAQSNHEDLMVLRGDLMRALDDIQPAFGVSEDQLKVSMPNGIIHYSPYIESILTTGFRFAQAVRTSEKLNLFSLLIHGPHGAGKTALATEIGLKSQFPFVKVVRPVDTGASESTKLEYLRRTFSDAYKSSLSIVILDNIEKIIEWNPIGPRFSNAVVQYIGALLEAQPPKGKKILIMATTSQRSMLHQHGTFEFDREIAVPAVKDHAELAQLLRDSGRLRTAEDVDTTLGELQLITGNQEVGIGVKAVFSAIESALTREPVAESLAEDLSAVIASTNAY